METSNDDDAFNGTNQISKTSFSYNWLTMYNTLL